MESREAGPRGRARGQQETCPLRGLHSQPAIGYPQARPPAALSAPLLPTGPRLWLTRRVRQHHVPPPSSSTFSARLGFTHHPGLSTDLLACPHDVTWWWLPRERGTHTKKVVVRMPSVGRSRGQVWARLWVSNILTPCWRSDKCIKDLGTHGGISELGGQCAQHPYSHTLERRTQCVHRCAQCVHGSTQCVQDCSWAGGQELEGPRVGAVVPTVLCVLKTYVSSLS